MPLKQKSESLLKVMKGLVDMKKKNKDAISHPSAEERVCINVENPVVSEPHTGEKICFDAESEKLAEEFQSLIEGKYKKQFSDKVQKIISRRLKEVKELKSKAESDAHIVELIMKKLNITDGDTEKLERMIDEMNIPRNDNAKSDMRNRIMQRLLAENGFLRKERENKMRSLDEANRKEKLKAEVEEAKNAYPGFDFKKELENPEFIRLIRVGVSVKNAYEVVNMDAIISDKSKEPEKMVIDSIRLKENRPVENGSSLNGGILLSNGISKLTRKQRADLAKRAARGEKIEF